MKIITVKVTSADIRKGETCGEHTCPIALALLRRLKPGIVPTVNMETVHFRKLTPEEIDPHRRITKHYRLPEKATAFIDAFDGNGTTDEPIRPFSFCLKVSEKVLL